MSDGSEVDRMQIARQVGLEWFKVHADQRLKIFNFFVLIAGFSIGGFFTCLQIKSALAATTVAFLLCIICICFKLLDMRTAQLVKHGEQMLSAGLSELGGNVPNVIEMAEKRGRVPSYRQIFNVVFLLFGVMSVIGMIFPWVFLKV
jgi:hypothetical protein